MNGVPIELPTGRRRNQCTEYGKEFDTYYPITVPYSTPKSWFRVACAPTPQPTLNSSLVLLSFRASTTYKYSAAAFLWRRPPLHMPRDANFAQVRMHRADADAKGNLRTKAGRMVSLIGFD